MIHEHNLELNTPLILNRDLVKKIKRGEPWLFQDTLATDKKKPLSSGLKILWYKESPIALGIYQADVNLGFRVLWVFDKKEQDKFFQKHRAHPSLIPYIKSQLEKKFLDAINFRKTFFDDLETDSYRIINGEGDGFPGMHIDRYNNVIVIKHDHNIMEKIYHHETIGRLLLNSFSHLECIYLKRRNQAEVKGQTIFGQLPEKTIFREHSILFSSHIKDAAKTGFFLDQRDNRQWIRKFSRDKNCLNVFSYTGGFSMAMAYGGAKSVCSIDIAPFAIEEIHTILQLNHDSLLNLNPYYKNNSHNFHHGIADDAFKIIEGMTQEKKQFELIVCDPPSFAPNREAIESAKNAYADIYAKCLNLLSPQGLIALSSCSSHITHEMFYQICEEAFSKSRKKGKVILVGGQPMDHPTPHAMKDLRYLKFLLFQVE